MVEKTKKVNLLPCYCANLRWVSREISHYYTQQLSKSGLPTTPFYTVLSILKLDGPLSMADLSAAVHLERTTLVRKLKLMQQEDLIRFINAETSAAKLAELTDKGQEILNVADKYWDEAQENFRAILSDAEMESLENILKKLVQINRKNEEGVPN